MNWKCVFPAEREMENWWIDSCVMSISNSACVNKYIGRALRHVLATNWNWIFVFTVAKLEHKISNRVIFDTEMCWFDDLLKFPLMCYMYSLPESHTLKHSYSVTFLLSKIVLLCFWLCWSYATFGPKKPDSM